ncbi:MAG TPA: hypothetical protein VJ797_10335 [Burkholderiales bacterium]|nr:hypothetical protein [Burkholderiales bacterium]
MRPLLTLALLACGSAHAADIALAAYDRERDELVVDVVYRGTNPNHDFTLQWDKCVGGQASARLIDTQGRDLAREEYRVRERFSLDGLQCRPATVTLRLGRTALASVVVPDEARP